MQKEAPRDKDWDPWYITERNQPTARQKFANGVELAQYHVMSNVWLLQGTAKYLFKKFRPYFGVK